MRSKLPPVIRDFSSLESLFMYLLTIKAGSSIGVFGPLLPISTRSAPDFVHDALDQGWVEHTRGFGDRVGRPL